MAELKIWLGYRRIRVEKYLPLFSGDFEKVVRDFVEYARKWAENNPTWKYLSFKVKISPRIVVRLDEELIRYGIKFRRKRGYIRIYGNS